jgi:hypothetical protein
MNAVFTMVKEMQMPFFHALPEGSIQENCLVRTLLNLNAASYAERIALSLCRNPCSYSRADCRTPSCVPGSNLLLSQ